MGMAAVIGSGPILQSRNEASLFNDGGWVHIFVDKYTLVCLRNAFSFSNQVMLK